MGGSVEKPTDSAAFKPVRMNNLKRFTEFDTGAARIGGHRYRTRTALMRCASTPSLGFERTVLSRPARFSAASEQPITRRLRHGRRSHAYALLVVDDILDRVDLVLNHLGARHQPDPVGLGEALGTEPLENA
ncbi:hypothetical protein [Nocardia gipuzkoensis]|uniref:hypothetical protein n=1 Tax=Nocardia gipuzkoensis TaxID=2749991 RepID=UPI00237E309C|nr:hypothetical protein [Nocardia gipuzkoensis]MDE1669962.1 hypothetical protein [Nocardia gipuzkoensis]